MRSSPGAGLAPLLTLAALAAPEPAWPVEPGARAPEGCLERSCGRAAFGRHAAGLQARHGLLDPRALARYRCPDGSEVVAAFFETVPPTLVAKRGRRSAVMFLERSASGARYRGRNARLWEHQDGAVIAWGYGAPEMRCADLAAQRDPGSAP